SSPTNGFGGEGRVSEYSASAAISSAVGSGFMYRLRARTWWGVALSDGSREGGKYGGVSVAPGSDVGPGIRGGFDSGKRPPPVFPEGWQASQLIPLRPRSVKYTTSPSWRLVCARPPRDGPANRRPRTSFPSRAPRTSISTTSRVNRSRTKRVAP